MTIEQSITSLIAPLLRQRIRCTREVDTHADLIRLWKDATNKSASQEPPWHEYWLLAESLRIDFYHAPSAIGIEVKIKGSSQAIARQLLSYAMTGKVSALILITAKPLEGFPEAFSVRGTRVPVIVHVLNHL